jgi:arylsulfatase A-like enzyme
MVRRAGLVVYCVGLAACDGHASDRPNVLLITIDTLRADHLGCYQYSRNTSPFLDQLAADGTLFLHCFSPVPVTLPSHSSLMTGNYPLYHGVRDNARYQHLDDSHVTLAETLRAAGYDTGAVVSAFVLDARFGIAQGFGSYDDDVDEAYHERRPGDRPPDDAEGKLLWERQRSAFHQRAARTTEKALRWLRRREGGAPFFLWVHYFDPHDHYDPPAPYDKMFAAAETGGRSRRVALYDGEIRYTDDQIRRLVQVAKGEESQARTIVIVAGDHGEGLGNHSVNGKTILYHGADLFTETVRVPLILHAPGDIPAQVINDRVGLLDVMPTVLGLLDIEVPQPVQGRSLVQRIRGEEVEVPRDLFFETLLPQIRHGDPPQKAVLSGPWKLILYGEQRRELYDLSSDPGERRNLAGAAASVSVVELCLEKIESWEQRVTNVAQLQNQVELDPTSLEKLRALGYVSDTDVGDPEAAADSGSGSAVE